MNRISASRLALLEHCQYFARDGVTWADTRSDAASFGTSIHALAEAYIRNPRAELVTADERLARVWAHVKAYIDEHRSLGWRPEVAFAFDPLTDAAHELPQAEHRDYSAATEREICGTADLVYMSSDEQGAFACVDDWKYSGFHLDAGRARAQLAALSLFVARAWGADRVRARALKISDTGVDGTSEVYWFDAFDLAAQSDSIARGLAAVGRAEPQPGEHCTGRWCPAISACPATQGALAQVIPAASLVKSYRYSPAIEGPDHLAWMLTVRPLLNKALEQVDDAVRAFVADGPVTTSEGATIRQTMKSLTKFDQNALLDLLSRKGASDDEIQSCVRTMQVSNGVRVSGAKKGRAA